MRVRDKAVNSNTKRVVEEKLNMKQGGAFITRSLNLPLYEIIIISILLLALFTRLIALALRPVQHDESMFAYYAHYWHKTGDYVYIPMLHGPLMIYVTGTFLWLFGDSDFSMRLATALMGVGIIALVLVLRRWLNYWGIIAAMLLLVFSPGIMHYSRLYRNDIPLLFFTFLLVLAISRLGRKENYPWTLFYLILLSTLTVCIKENSVFMFFMAGTYGLLMLFVDLLQQLKRLREQKAFRRDFFAPENISISAICALIILFLFWLAYHFTGDGTLQIFSTKKFISFKSPLYQYFGLLLLLAILTGVFAWIRPKVLADKDARCMVTQCWLNLRKNWLFLILGFVVSLIVYILIFTDFLKHPKGVFKIYQDTFAYWWGQHKEHRIKGEFHFYMVLLLLYELPALIIVLIGASKHLWEKKWLRYRLIPGYFFLAFMIAALFSWVELDKEFWDKTFHLTSKWHIFIISTLLVFGTVLTIIYLSQQRRFLAFLLWWSFVGLLMYSYAGEKVPWLLVHITLPLILLAGAYIGEFAESGKFKRRPLFWLVIFGLLVFWQMRNCLLLCFYHYDSPRERMNYAHFLRDVKKVAEEIQRLAFLLRQEQQPKIVITDINAWGFRWYLRNYENWREGESVANTTAPILIVEWNKAKKTPNILQNYRITFGSNLSWWQPSAASLKPMLGIWRWLIPRQYRKGETEQLLRISIDEWKKVLNWVLFRKTFDPYGARWPTLSTVDFAFCIRKDILY